MVDRRALEQAVTGVADPCGLLYGTNTTFGELGMIEALEVDGSTVTVRLLLDDPNCLYLPRIIANIEAAAKQVPGVERVVIANRGDEIWTEARMTEEGRRKLHEHRRRRKEQLRRVAELHRQRRESSGLTPVGLPGVIRARQR
jgi:metal-sulfur cluster biosynthetic enzyme